MVAESMGFRRDNNYSEDQLEQALVDNQEKFILELGRGFAYQMNHAITMLFSNFYTAVRPQITKYYAQKNYGEMYKLVFCSFKKRFFFFCSVF